MVDREEIGLILIIIGGLYCAISIIIGLIIGDMLMFIHVFIGLGLVMIGALIVPMGDDIFHYPNEGAY